MGAGLVVAVFACASILRDNLQKLGLSLGFDFLQRPAGFEIGVTFLPYSSADSFWYAIAIGAINTCVLVIAAGVMSSIVGVGVGILRTSANPLVRGITSAYVELMRNTPLLMQILLWSSLLLKLPSAAQAWRFGGAALSQRGLFLPMVYPLEGSERTFAMCFGLAFLLGVAAAVLLRIRYRKTPGRPGALRNGWVLPVILGVLVTALLGLGAAAAAGSAELSIPQRKGFNFQGGISLTPEFVSLFIALTLYFGAFIAEIVRNGIETVQKGQWEASRSLGMSEIEVVRWVVLPQTVRLILPAVIAQYVSLIKNSSLAIAVGYPDLFWSVFTMINVTGHAIEGVLVLAAAYLALTLGTSWLFNRWYQKLRRKG